MTECDEVSLIIDESGNSFHCKVTNFFKSKGWSTQVSPYYMDGGTNKPREIDLIAEKAWLFDDGCGGRRGNINIKLFIECKYIPNTNVFWFSDKDRASAKEWVSRNTPLKENGRYIEQYHYLSINPKVAKLFASKNKPNIENEVIYKALNQSLNAMINLRGKRSIVQDKNYSVLGTVEIPVIICNSFNKFHRVDMEEPNNHHEPIDDNFQLEVNYAYTEKGKINKNEFFLIDIVDFNKLDDFLALMESDKEAIIQDI